MDLATPAATKAVGSLALLVVAGLGWLLVVGPETDALAQAREEISTVRDQNTVLTSQLAALERQREGLAETRRDARRLAELFPPTADQPGMFEEVTTAAVDAGIGPQGVTTLTPTPPVLGTTGTEAAAAPAPDPAADPATDPAAAPAAGAQLLARQTVTVAVTGTYDQTQRLLENLEHMPRAYLVTAVALASGSEGGEFTTTITGDMFVMPPVIDPGKTLNLSSTTRPEG